MHDLAQPDEGHQGVALTEKQDLFAWPINGARPLDETQLTIIKFETLLDRQSCVVPNRMMYRFATERRGFGGRDTTVRIVDGDPGSECQVDFGSLGYLADPASG